MFQLAQQEVFIRDFRAADALFQAVKPVIDVGFVFLQKGGYGGGREAGHGKHIEEVILFFKRGKGKAETLHHLLAPFIQRMLQTLAKFGILPESVHQRTHFLQHAGLQIFSPFIDVILFKKSVQYVQADSVGLALVSAL